MSEINKQTRLAACRTFLAGGVTRTDVARAFGVDNSTVAYWLRRLEEGGEDALDYAHADRKRKNHLLDPAELRAAWRKTSKRLVRDRISRLIFLANGGRVSDVRDAFGVTPQAVMKDRKMWLDGNFPTQKNKKPSS